MIRHVVGVIVLLGLPACAEQAPAPPEPKPFEITVGEGIRLGGVELGAGPPLVVVHGGPGMDHMYLRPALDALADGRRVVYVDQRGTGLSAGPSGEPDVRFEDLIDDLERVREWAGAETVDLLAHSWGSTVALHYALRYPDRLGRMVLVAPVEPGSRFAAAAAERREARIDSTDRVRLTEIQASESFRAGDRALLEEWYALVFRPLLHDRDVSLAVPLHPATARNGFAVMSALGPTMPDPELWGRLRDIRSPVLLVHGASDAYPVAMVEAYRDSLPDGELLLLEAAGHFAYLERPDLFLKGVRAFLERGAAAP